MTMRFGGGSPVSSESLTVTGTAPRAAGTHPWPSRFTVQVHGGTNALQRSGRATPEMPETKSSGHSEEGALDSREFQE